MNKSQEKNYPTDCLIAPLCFSQRGIYADCMKNPDSLMYNQPAIIRLPKSCTAGELEAALRKLMKVHPCLNVRIRTDRDGNPVQELPLDQDEVSIKYIRMNSEELELYKKSAVRPFDTEHDERLYRLEIIQTEQGCVLFSDFHHLIFDGMSQNVFYQQLHDILSGNEIPEKVFNGMQLAKEQYELEKSGEYAQMLEFWKSRTSLVESATDIYPQLFSESDKPGIERKITVGLDAGKVKRFSRSIGIRPSVIYLASVLYTLSAYTGDTRIGIMTVSGGRKDVRLKDSIGMFANTLPIIADTGYEKVAEFLTETQKIFDEAIAHENVAFADIAAESDYHPNILFIYLKDLIGWDYEFIGKGTAKFHLQFAVTGNGNDLILEMIYDENRYTAEMIKGISKTVASVCSQMCEKQYLKQISFCDEKQLALLDSFNKKTIALQTEDSVVSMFRRTAEKYPDKTAVVYKDRSISYEQLDRDTDILAAWIENFSDTNRTDHEPVVSILAGRSEYMVICALAALKAGCAYQPLDPSYPRERINYMINDALPVLLMTDADSRGKADDYHGRVLHTEEIEAILSGEYRKPEAEINSSSLFIILYTSGSTGNPKGVMLEHGNLTAFCRWYHEYYNLKEDDRVGAYAGFGFDACMMDIYPALTRGASVYIISEEMRLDLDAVNRYFNENAVTHSFMTTQVGVQFHNTQQNHSLYHLSVGGEKLVPVKPSDRYILYNGYGPTECTVFSVTKAVTEQEDNIPIGKPTLGINCYVMDNLGRRLPMGACGELILCGTQVGRGYLGMPDLTEKAFFEINGVRAYRTGDIVRYRSNGDLEFIGRRDRQIKIRGYRIELAEIEAVIREYGKIKDVTVQTSELPNRGKCLIAYVVPSDGYDKKLLKEYILKKKPAYMMPAAFISMDSIPLNSNQKVNKAALPGLPHSISETHFLPENEKERVVSEIVRSILGLESMPGISDSFVALGGDSISAIRLSSLLGERNIKISASAILRIDSLKAIAEKAEYQDSGKNKDRSRTLEGFIDNTAIVQYFFDLKLVRPEHFNQAMLYRAGEPVNMDVLRNTVERLVEIHDMLRAVVRNGRLFIRDADPVSVTEMFTDDIEAEAEKLEESIDLGNGPLLKVCLFHHIQEDYLLIVMHHLITDGISWRILTEDLNALYRNLKAGETSYFPGVTDTYADYEAALKKYRNSEGLKKQKDYWDRVRNRCRQLPFSDRREEARAVPHMARSYVEITEDFSAGLLSGPVMNGTGRQIYMLAALGKAYYCVTGEKELSVNLEGHGREEFCQDLSIDRTVGWFTSIFPIVLDHLDEDMSVVLKATEKTLREVPEKGFGYGQLYGMDTSIMPLLTFNFMGAFSEKHSTDVFLMTRKYSVGEMISPENKYGTDLNFNGILQDGVIRFSIDYNTARFSPKQINRMADEFIMGVNEICNSGLMQDIGVIADEKQAAQGADEDEIFVYSEGADKIPLILIHTANSGSEAYYRLASEIKDEVALAVIELYNIRHPDGQIDNIRDMASEYIKIMKRHQPEGPYNLGGWCFGGMVAYEMACQLTESGETVERLVIFDSQIIEDDDLREALIENDRLHSREYLSTAPLFEEMRSKGLLETLVSNSEMVTRSWLSYEPSGYNGDVIFIKACKKADDTNVATDMLYDRVSTLKACGYEKYVCPENLKVLNVMADHDSLMEDYAIEQYITEFMKYLQTGVLR